MAASPKDLALELLEALRTKNLDRMNAVLAADATFSDPHYQPPVMVGREAINAGMTWATGFLKRMDWTVLRSWETDNSVVLEVATNHLMPDGSPYQPPQIFIVDAKDGKITRWQSFLPYPPPAPPAA